MTQKKLTIPQQETLEEAQEQTALKYFNEQYRGSIADTKESLEQSIKVFHDAFKAGQQWQAERMYSEEDMKKAWSEGYHRKVDEINGNELRYFNDWIEQFKKK
jgi:hypothetical protein